VRRPGVFRRALGVDDFQQEIGDRELPGLGHEAEYLVAGLQLGAAGPVELVEHD